MGKLRGFLEYDRIDEANIPVADRVKNYKEFTVHPGEEKLQDQGARCMDCGVPFCHSGCPLGNMIPDFNDAVYQNDWHKALRILGFLQVQFYQVFISFLPTLFVVKI